MITKAVIEEVISKNFVRVRIPMFDKSSSSVSATKYDDLSRATICVPPNVFINTVVGDIVYVAFEDNDVGRPVVIGYLSKDGEIKSSTDVQIQNLSVTNNINIGEVNRENILALAGMKNNIKDELDRKQTKLYAGNGISITTNSAGKTEIGVNTTYSTSEQAVGTWIDGKTIYRKTFYANVGVGSNLWTRYLSMSDVNVDKLWFDTSASFVCGEYISFPMHETSDTSYYRAYYDNGARRVMASGRNESAMPSMYCTVLYTKTE